MKIQATIAFVFLLFCAVQGAAYAQLHASHGVQSSEPKLMVVKFHADWCGSCKAMGSVVTDLTNKLDGEPVLFTELDFTNNSTKHQSLLLASALGIEKALTDNKGTGFLLVIDTKSKQVKAKLTKTQSVKDMTKAIAGML